VAVLTDEDVQRVARAVADLLDERQPQRLVDAATLAQLLGVTRGFVYEHSDRLGAVRTSDRAKARLRFDVDTAVAALAALEAGRHSAAPAVEP
jgi:hypothetical protein